METMKAPKWRDSHALSSLLVAQSDSIMQRVNFTV